MRIRIPLLCFALLALSSPLTSRAAAGPFQASGIKIGEATDSTAIVWTRLTRNAAPNPADGPVAVIEYTDGTLFRSDDEDKNAPTRHGVRSVTFEGGEGVDDLRYGVPGSEGKLRVRYRPEGSGKWQSTPWEAVDPQRDFTRQFRLEELQPDTRYELSVEARGDAQPVAGSFRTAPAADAPARVVFTVTTGQRFPHRDREDGFEMYGSMLKLDPSFFVHTGDILYYDQLGKTVDLARYHWHRMYSLPTNIEFHRRVASYFIKDDHDTWQNDCWPTMQNEFMHEFTFAQGQALFLEQVPMGETTYRTFRWGKDLQIWLVEGRDFRSANTDMDGPDKTIWGGEQMEWFQRTVTESDATFRVLISPTPVVGPDRSTKADNHSNASFAHEGERLRAFLSGQKNMAVVCGDRHWQYHSLDPDTGLQEFSCGPASDEHAGGWSQEDFVEEYHRFLKVSGGFLSGTVERHDGACKLTFRFHDVHGDVRHTAELTADASR